MGATRRGLLLAAAAGLAGCARPGIDVAPVQATPPAPLVYWKSLTGPRHDAQVRLVDAFNESQTAVRATLEHAGEYGPAAAKLRVALASGAVPDAMLLSVNTDLPAFARMGALQPLDALVAREPERHRFYPTLLEDGRVDRRLFQLPFARSVPLLFANQELLAGAGLREEDASPATWDAYLDVCRRVQVARPEEPVSGITTSWWEFQSTLWSFGGAYSDQRGVPLTASPRSLAAFQFQADLVHRHGLAAATKQAQKEFLAGGRAFLTGSSASLTEIMDGAPFRAGAARLPAPASGGPGGVPGGGAGLVLLEDSTRHEAGWAFLRFMTSTESAAMFSGATGYSPVRPNALGRPEVQRLLARHPEAAVALGELSRMRPVDAVLAKPGASTHIQDALQQMLFDGAPVRQTCEALADALRRLASGT